MVRRHRRNKNSILTTVIFVVFLVALIGFCVYSVITYRENHDTTESANVTDDINTAEYIVAENNTSSSPDNGEESSNSDAGNEFVDIKEAAEAAERKPEVEKNDDGLKIAKPQISFAGIEGEMLVVSASITNILDEEGECEFIITNGNASESIKKGILPNAKNSVCDAVVIDKNSSDFNQIKTKLGAGTWSAKVKYKSDYAEGESEKVTFTVN